MHMTSTLAAFGVADPGGLVCGYLEACFGPSLPDEINPFVQPDSSRRPLATVLVRSSRPPLELVKKLSRQIPDVALELVYLSPARTTQHWRRFENGRLTDQGSHTQRRKQGRPKSMPKLKPWQPGPGHVPAAGVKTGV